MTHDARAEANQRASPAPVAAAKEQPGLATTTPMAVTGIGCRLPGSNSPAQFWANLEADGAHGFAAHVLATS